MKDKISRYLVNIPPYYYWALFFVFTGCFTVTKIAASDLWWHMACGRFLVENGFYPPTGTFTFSPVNPTTANIATWLGDIFLYLVYWSSGELGLQVFRFILILVPVVVLVSVSEKRYNPWLLLASILTVAGVVQISLLRNSIYGLFFLPLIVWIWWYIKKKGGERSYYLIFLYPAIIGLWSVMHGYALVGTAIILLIFAGEMLDLFLRKDSRKFFHGGIFLVVAVACYLVVNINLSMNITGIVSSFFQKDQQTISETVTNDKENCAIVETFKNEKNSGEQEVEKEDGIDVVSWIKTKSRFLLKGGDVGFIAEFNSPLDSMGMISTKAVVLLSFLYLLYLVCALVISPSSIRISFLLPSLASIILGLGYIRTVAFPFLVALPLMVSGFSDLVKVVQTGGKPLFLFLRNKRWVYVNLFPLLGCIVFFGLSQYYCLTNSFHLFSGISYCSPGIGRADIYQTRMPEYILENFPDEQMFNSYNTGSRLLWEWYGKKKVFIDSRSITYQQDFYDDFRGNYSFESFQKMDLNKALLNPLMDNSWYEAYFKLNWNLMSFDTGMMLMERRVKEGYDNYYGRVPEFIGTPEDVARMSLESKEKFGVFLNWTIKYMLLFGRFEDSLKFYSSMEKAIDKLPATIIRGSLKAKFRLMNDVKDDFGVENSKILADLFREILLDDKEMRQDAFLDYERSKVSIYVAFANAHLEFGNKRKAIDYFMKAADTDQKNLDLQVKIGDHFFKIKALGPAIRQYKRVVAIDSTRVHEFNKLGYLFYQKGETEEAEDAFERALKADPDVVESYVNLAAMLMDNDEKKAITIIKKGLIKDPDNVQLRSMMQDIDTRIKND